MTALYYEVPPALRRRCKTHESSGARSEQFPRAGENPVNSWGGWLIWVEFIRRRSQQPQRRIARHPRLCNCCKLVAFRFWFARNTNERPEPLQACSSRLIWSSKLGRITDLIISRGRKSLTWLIQYAAVTVRAAIFRPSLQCAVTHQSGVDKRVISVWPNDDS